MENFDNNELFHHGRKGMKWGQNIFGRKNQKGSVRGGGKNEEKTRRAIGTAVKNLDAKRQSNDNRKKEKDAVEVERIQAEREKLKQKIAKSRNAAEVYKHADLFTNQELSTIYNRLQTEENIKRLAPKKGAKAKQIADDIVSWGDTASRYISTGTKIYNGVAAIYNTFGGKGEVLPIIPASKNKSKNNFAAGFNKKKQQDNSIDNNDDDD